MPQPDRPGTPGYGEDGKEKEGDRKTVETKIWRMRQKKLTGVVQPVQKTWLSTRETMKLLDISDDTLKRLRDSGEIDSYQYGTKLIWYDYLSIQRFMNRCRV